jgi:predicted GNAT superfamily acetyltransferase
VHALNQVHAEELSSMTLTAFTEMAGCARYARVIEEQVGFLLAFVQPPTTESPNFSWFESRYRNFLYIDRRCIDGGARRRGYAGALYSDLSLSPETPATEALRWK